MKHRPLLLATLTSAAFAVPAYAQQAFSPQPFAQQQYELGDKDWSASIIRQVEQKLKQMNFVVGPVDGVMDPKTHYGIRQFQRSRGDLTNTGSLNMETLAALGIPQSSYISGAEQRGRATREPYPEFSREVARRAEQALANKQFVTGEIDGILDPATRYGLQNFQRFMDLAQTGDLNAETLSALGVQPVAGATARERQRFAGAGVPAPYRGAERVGAPAGTGQWAAPGSRAQRQQQTVAPAYGVGAAAGGATAQGDQTYAPLYSPQVIRAVERALKNKNYVTGPVNGVIEPETEYGLTNFQLDYRLAPTGNLNFETLEALGIDNQTLADLGVQTPTQRSRR